MDSQYKESISVIGKPRASRLSLAESTMDPEMITTPLQQASSRKSIETMRSKKKYGSFGPGVDRQGNPCKLYGAVGRNFVEVCIEFQSISNLMVINYSSLWHAKL